MIILDKYANRRLAVLEAEAPFMRGPFAALNRWNQAGYRKNPRAKALIHLAITIAVAVERSRVRQERDRLRKEVEHWKKKFQAYERLDGVMQQVAKKFGPALADLDRAQRVAQLREDLLREGEERRQQAAQEAAAAADLARRD